MQSAGDLWNGWEEVSFAGPSFIGTYFGVNFIPGSRRASDGMRMRFRSGGTAGVEGAYFFLPYAGVGGRIGVSDMSAENPFGCSFRAQSLCGLRDDAFSSVFRSSVRYAQLRWRCQHPLVNLLSQG